MSAALSFESEQQTLILRGELDRKRCSRCGGSATR